MTLANMFIIKLKIMMRRKKSWKVLIISLSVGYPWVISRLYIYLARKRTKTGMTPPQWINCDIRYLDLSVLGKFSVIMADPPWDIHMELPYGTMTDEEMKSMRIKELSDDGLFFLWVSIVSTFSRFIIFQGDWSSDGAWTWTATSLGLYTCRWTDLGQNKSTSKADSYR